MRPTLTNHHCYRYSLFNRLLVPLFNVESLVKFSSVSVYARFVGCLRNYFLPPKKFLTGIRFFFFLILFLYFHRTLPFKDLHKLTSFINLVHLITCLSLHLFQPNICQHFSHVYSTSQTGFSLKEQLCLT